jgi:hypothetical protein
MIEPNCYSCVHRLTIPGDAHTRCNNHTAKVEGNPHGIRKGWFLWPLNFDPVWLEKCDGFSDKPEDKREVQKLDPLVEIMAMLKGRF